MEEGRERERERERQAERDICCSTYLCIHWFILVCALTLDLTRNFGVSGCSNQLSHLDRAKLHSFTCGYLVSPASFVEKTLLFPLFSLGTLKEDCLTIDVRVYFWALYSVPLVLCLSLCQCHIVLITVAL